MIEPEMAFCDPQQNMALAKALIQYLAAWAMEHCTEDLNLFAKFVNKELTARLELLARSEFVRLPSKEPVSILEKSGRKF